MARGKNAKRGMSLSAYAKYRGCSRQSVYNAEERGCVVRYVDGSIDADATDAAWDAGTATTQPAAHRPSAHKPGKGQQNRRGTQQDYWKAKARREAAAAQREEIKLAVEKGLLVSREAVVLTMARRGKLIEERLRRFPLQIASRVPEEYRAQVREIAEQLVEDACRDMSRAARGLK